MSDSDYKHEQEYIPVDKIVPNEWNANEQDDKNFGLLVEDIAETGFIDSVTVVPMEDGTYRLIGGEHRWRAARALGELEIPALILRGDKWKHEDLQKFTTVKMNIIKGKLNPQKFAALYNEMAEKYGTEQLQKLFGFTSKSALQKVLKGVVSGAKKSLPKEMHKELEERAKNAKTAEDLGVIVQELFAEYGDTMNQSYMILSHGGQEHLYIRMDDDLRKAMDKVMIYCDYTKTDINSILSEIVREGVGAKAEELEVEPVEKESPEENPYE